MIVTITSQKVIDDVTINKIQIINGYSVDNIIQVLSVYDNSSVSLTREFKGSSEYIDRLFDRLYIDSNNQLQGV